MKRLLALALALIMIFCLAACGESKKNNDDDDSKTTKPTTGTPAIPGLAEGTKVGISIADLDKLLAPLMGGSAGTNVKDIYLEVGASDEAVLLALGAQLMGKDVDANLFLGENIILSAPALLDKNYGISMSDLANLLKELVMSSTGDSAADVSSILTSLDPQVVIELLGKYYNLLINEIKSADGITATEEDGIITISGQLDSNDLAAIVVNIIEAACADDELFDLIGSLQGMSGDDFKAAFLQGKPSKDVLLSQMQQMLAGFAIDIQIDELVLSGGLPVAADLTASMNLPMEDSAVPVVVDMAYDLASMECDISVKMAGAEVLSLTMGNGTVEMNMDMGGMTMEAKITMTDTGISGYMKQNDVEIMSFSFNITDNGFKATMTSNGETMSVELVVGNNSITLTLNMNRSEIVLNAKVTNDGAEGSLKIDGVEMGKIVFTKTVDGSKTAFTLATLSVQGTTLDFSAGGLSFYIDTDADVPSAPDFVNVATMSNSELEAVLQKFLSDNADLMEMISGLFGGGSVESAPATSVSKAA